MSSSRAPWWMYIIAASFLGLFVLRIYVLSPLYPGPGPLGIYFDERSSPVIVERVEPGSIAERAGLRAGDRIVSANGIDMSLSWRLKWNMASMNFEVGRPLRLDIEREGRRIELSMIPERRSQTVFRFSWRQRRFSCFRRFPVLRRHGGICPRRSVLSCGLPLSVVAYFLASFSLSLQLFLAHCSIGAGSGGWFGRRRSRRPRSFLCSTRLSTSSRRPHPNPS